MRKIVVLLLLFKALTINGQGCQYESISAEDLNEYELITDTLPLIYFDSYGMEINNFYTHSGFNSGMEAAIFVKDSNKTLQLGAYFDTKTSSLAGFVLSHKHYIFNNKNTYKKVIYPYLFYNLIYRQSVYNKPLFDPNYNQLMYSAKARYTSLEHYIGIGVDIDIYNYIYFNINLGFGGYLGSIKRPVTDSTIGLYIGTDGWGGIAKFGFGFKIP